jgi:peptide deformylase
MVKPLKYYPDESINVNAGPIRDFGKSYKDMKQDIIETMREHNLDGLSAIQIGYPYHLMVIKKGENYVAYANARIITQKEPFSSEERSSYFRDRPIRVTRYKELSVVYEDENGEMQREKIDDKELASLFQRKLDYLFNTTLLDRVPLNQREQAIKSLKGQGLMPKEEDNFCPPFSKKEYFISVADKLLFFMLVSLFLPLFDISKETLNSWYTYDKIAFPSVILLLIGFFLYAQHEAKKYKQCTSCQIGNNIGVVIKRGAIAITLLVSSYFIFNLN